MMNNNKFSWLKESYVFYGVLLFNLLLLSTVKFFPSSDGPAHLYNSNIICHLLKGDSSIINDFFSINKFPVPNWTGHFILSIFCFIFPSWLAEKVLLFIYLTGIAVSFRLLIKELCPENKILSIFIFPFAYSFLFHLGFYNFSFSFVFLFLTIYYWLKTRNNQTFKKYLLLFLLITLTYFSNILTYCFLGLCLGLLIIAYAINEYFQERNVEKSIKLAINNLLFLFIVSLPSILLILIFYNTTTFFPTDAHYTSGELVKWINDVRPLIVYDYLGDERITQQFLHLMIVIVSISLFIRFQKNPSTGFVAKINIIDVLLLPAIIALILLFIVPNGSSAGMMSDCYSLLFYMLIIVWVMSQPLPKKVSQIIVILLIVFHLGLLFKHMNGGIRSLNRDALAITEASKQIKPNSIVFQIDMNEGDWLESHFSNYAGIDKPVVILENYEASVGWFPVVWNIQKMPQLLLGDKKNITGVQWTSNVNSPVTKQIDYALIYGNIEKINDPKWNDLKAILLSKFDLVYTDNKFIELFNKK